MKDILFTKFYKTLLLVLTVTAVSIALSSCKKDESKSKENAIGYMLFCPAGTTAACKESCVIQFDKDGDGAVEDIYSSQYGSCTSQCDTYCNAMLLKLYNARK
jgi:hypothetical protein